MQKITYNYKDIKPEAADRIITVFSTEATTRLSLRQDQTENAQ